MGQNVITYTFFHIYLPAALHVEKPFLLILSEVHSPQRRWNQTSVMQSNPRFYFFALTKGSFCRKILFHLYTLNNQCLNSLWLSVSELSVPGEQQDRNTKGRGEEWFQHLSCWFITPRPLHLFPPESQSSFWRELLE